MSQSMQSRHPLTVRHHNQLGRRAGQTWTRMRPVWGISWRPGMGNGSFLGNLFRNFGTPVMMVQVGYQEEGREHVGVFGITAQIDPRTSKVSYDKCVMRHDFFHAPFPGAKAAILNTRNESWIQLALDIDRVRQRQVERNHVLPAIPKMPEIYYGFGSKESAKFEITPALRAATYADQEISVRTKAIKGLNNLDSGIAAAREQAFHALPEETQRERLVRSWQAAFIPPTDPENTTGLWLLPHKYSTAAMSATRVFEYFGGMVGADVFNFARKLEGRSVENKAVEIAKAHGVYLEQVITDLATTAEGDPKVVELENMIRELIPIYREKQPGLPENIDDDGIIMALANYSDPLVVEPAVQKLPEKAQLVAMKSIMPPHIANCCTDEDLLRAVQNPQQPLYARGLCQVQTLYRNVKTPLAEALAFTSADLDRERVSASFWNELPVSKPKRKQPRPQKKQQEVPAHAE